MALAARSSSAFALARRLTSPSSSTPRRGRPVVATRTATRSMGATIPDDPKFTIPDQPARFAQGKADNNSRMLTTDFFDGTLFKNKRVLVTGGNRGVGLALVRELVACGADTIVACRSSNEELDGMKEVQVIVGCDVTDTASIAAMAEQVTNPIDVLINNVGLGGRVVQGGRRTLCSGGGAGTTPKRAS